MQLSNNELFLLANCAITAAYQAGHLITRHCKPPIAVKNKKGGTSIASQVVTEVDTLSQELILNTLQPTCDLFDIAILSEEKADNRGRLYKDYFWCIDPLDGTLPFIEQRSGYAVSIALITRSGSALIGVIYDPITQTLYHAINGGGAFRNGHPWQQTDHPSPEDQSLTIISDRSFVQTTYYREIMTEITALAQQLGYSGIKTIDHGGAVMNACWVLENAPGCYFKFPKSEHGGGSLWDYGASACLFQEMGAWVSNIHGAALELNRSETTFMNHEGIIYASNKAIGEYIKDLYIRRCK